MAKVKFLPVDMVCDASEGETILEVALNHDVPIQHACGGFCSCTTCHVHLVEGQELVSEMDEDEEERIASVDRLLPHSRLACQAKVKGDLVVDILNLE